MKKIIFTLMFTLFFFASLAYAESMNLSWDPSAGATGYRIEQSSDSGTTWTVIYDGNSTVCSVDLTGIDSLTFWRVVSYNDQFNAFRSESGWWYNPNWVMPDKPNNMTME